MYTNELLFDTEDYTEEGPMIKQSSFKRHFMQMTPTSEIYSFKTTTIEEDTNMVMSLAGLTE